MHVQLCSRADAAEGQQLSRILKSSSNAVMLRRAQVIVFSGQRVKALSAAPMNRVPNPSRCRSYHRKIAVRSSSAWGVTNRDVVTNQHHADGEYAHGHPPIC